MKNVVLFLSLFFCTNLSAQFEIKTNPIALLFEVGLVSMEFTNGDTWGGELDLGFASEFYAIYLTGKHYFNPKYGGDRFNVGAFVGTAGGGGDNGGGIGFMAGYKAVSKNNILLELALGAGRDFGSDIEVLPYLKFHIGYRFGDTAKKD